MTSSILTVEDFGGMSSTYSLRGLLQSTLSLADDAYIHGVNV